MLLRARRPPALPPPALRFMKESDERFLAMGDEALERLRTFAGLGPRSFVVDIGCGYGRVAHALLRSKEFSGRYAGVDILPAHVKWCNDELGRHGRGRFTFTLLDVQNDRYNPNGTLSPAEVRLPVDDGSADVVVLLSVFTHMRAPHIVHYLGEVERILAPEGRAAATFLLLNDSSIALVEQGRGTYKLPYRLDDVARVMSMEDPLHAIAYEEGWVLEQAERARLSLARPPLHGTWCGRENGEWFQDLLVFARGR